MQKVISAIKWLLSNFFFLTIAAAVVVYLWWFQVAPIGYEVDDAAAYLFGIGLLILYGFIAAKLNRIINILRVLFLGLSFLMLFINGLYLYRFVPTLVSTAKCNGVTYYGTSHLHFIFSDWDYDRVTKRRGLFYEPVTWQFYSIGRSPSIIVCDEMTSDAKIYNNNNHLMFSDKTGLFSFKSVIYYDLSFETTLDGLSYSLYSYDSSYDENGIRKYLLTVCEPDKLETCKYIPLNHSSPTSQEETGSVIADLGAHEVYVIFDNKIYFAFEGETRQFDLVATQEPYQLATYRSNNTYVYVLYECYPDQYSSYCDCEYIPFSYSTTDLRKARLEFDNNSNKLFVFIDNNLIFTYRVLHNETNCYFGCPESECLVAGCTIPGQ